MEVYEGCPEQVEIVGTDPNEGAYHLFKEWYGDYKVQKTTVGDKPWYKKENNQSLAIWFTSDQYHSWIIGYTKDIKTDGGVAYNADSSNCPDDVFPDKWKYWVTCINLWIYAGDNLKVVAH